MMIARIDSGIRLDRGSVPPQLMERLRRSLSFPNPAYFDRLRLGRSVRGIPESLCFLDETEAELRLPRGAILSLKRLAAVDGQIVACEDRRILPAHVLPDLPMPPLRPYQERAVEAMVRITQGTVVVPCGGGKTRMGLGVIARLCTPALVLVHTLGLAEQWRSEIHSHLGLEAGLIGDGQENPGPVTVALVQALIRWERSRLDDFLRRFGLVILDEAHHVAAPVFHELIDRCPARYRFGLTATPEREDGLTALLDLFLGPPVFRVTHEELIAAEVLKLPEVRMVETAFSFPYERAEDYGRMVDALVRDDARNTLVADLVATEAASGHLCLVLSGRIEQCETLVGLIRERGVRAELLTGSVKKDRRTELLASARDGALPVLVATTLADEGLDLPALSRVILAYPSRARGRTLQRLGRLMRSHPEKEDAVLFDIVDRNVPILRRHHVERRSLYAEVLGLQAEVWVP